MCEDVLGGRDWGVWAFFDGQKTSKNNQAQKGERELTYMRESFDLAKKKWLKLQQSRETQKGWTAKWEPVSLNFGINRIKSIVVE